jgi:CelD/BcsL family acetyltransferase involved in cellulose biosynthesis
VLRFIGSGEVCSDHLDLIVRKKNWRATVRVIWEQLMGPLARKWHVLDYHDSSVDSPFLNEIRELADADDRCVNSRISEMTVCPYIQLPESWDAFESSLSANQRRALKVSLSRLGELGELRLDRCDSFEKLDGQMNSLIDLNRKSWRYRGQPGSFSTPSFEHFHRELAKLLLAENQLALCTLRINEEVVGSFYGLLYDRRMHFYVLGVKHDVAPGASVGRVLLAECIKEAIRMRCEEFDLLRGAERYKSDWTDRARRNLTLTIYNRRFMTFLWMAKRSLMSTIRTGVKVTLGDVYTRLRDRLRARNDADVKPHR